MNKNIYQGSKLLGLLLLLSIYGPILLAQPADKNATIATKNLLKSLHRLSGNGVLFGHQDDLAYGTSWKYEAGRSDIKELTGEYPAMFGWDLSGIEKDKADNIDGVPFLKMKTFIKQAYDMGAVNTISWHLDNPVNGKTSWDTTSASIPHILPGGSKHQLYLSWLDKLATFMSSLKGSDGKQIPIIFRPYHELTGSWFWWGKNQCSPAEYITLYQFTQNYLKNTRKVHNLIYVYNVADYSSREEYLERYPGDDYVDVLSFDAYQYGAVSNGPAFVKDLNTRLGIQKEIADEHHKLAALAEFGYVEIPDPDWWTNVIWKTIQPYQIAYLMAWRNAGYRAAEKDNHYYAPYKGQTSAADFLKFYQEEQVMFQKKAARQNLYK
jgi:mannan endo-1,4-beta-mannosidase